jgi:hypothetical protein
MLRHLPARNPNRQSEVPYSTRVKLPGTND